MTARESEIERENVGLRQVLSIIAASYPSQYMTGKTKDRVQRVCDRVIKGQPIFDDAPLTTLRGGKEET